MWEFWLLRSEEPPYKELQHKVYPTMLEIFSQKMDFNGLME